MRLFCFYLQLTIRKNMFFKSNFNQITRWIIRAMSDVWYRITLLRLWSGSVKVWVIFTACLRCFSGNSGSCWCRRCVIHVGTFDKLHREAENWSGALFPAGGPASSRGEGLDVTTSFQTKFDSFLSSNFKTDLFILYVLKQRKQQVLLTSSQLLTSRAAWSRRSGVGNTHTSTHSAGF